MKYIDEVMGIPMSIDIRDDSEGGDLPVAASAAFDILVAADRRFSTYSRDSEVSAVIRGEISREDFSDDLREVLRIASEAQRASRGAFTVWPPGGVLDTNGVVKGWAVQRAADALTAAGVRNFCINAGGDVVVRGVPFDGAVWQVGVRSPFDAAAMATVLAVTDCGVATSGSYERGGHIVDGRTGLTARDLASVTIVADDLTTADVLATAVFALGVTGIGWALDQGATGVLAVMPGGALEQAGSLTFASAS